MRPQASEGEAQHGPFCWTGRFGPGLRLCCVRYCSITTIERLAASSALAPNAAQTASTISAVDRFDPMEVPDAASPPISSMYAHAIVRIDAEPYGAAETGPTGPRRKDDYLRPTSSELRAMADDIADHGLREPIVTLEGRNSRVGLPGDKTDPVMVVARKPTRHKMVSQPSPPADDEHRLGKEFNDRRRYIQEGNGVKTNRS